MLLYVIRHAAAVERGDPEYPDDALRPLTRQGRKQFSRAIKKLAARGFLPQLLATSPLVRCRQTAKVIVKKVIAKRVAEVSDVVELEALAPGSNLAALIAWTNERQAESVGWVGHAPDVDTIVARLIGGADSGIRMAKGAIAALEFDGPVSLGAGQLRWLVTPAVLGC